MEQWFWFNGVLVLLTTADNLRGVQNGPVDTADIVLSVVDKDFPFVVLKASRLVATTEVYKHRG